MKKPPALTRRAVMADVTQLVELGRTFHTASALRMGKGYCAESAARTLKHIIGVMQEDGDALLVVSDHMPNVITRGGPESKLGGMLAMIAAPDYFDFANKTAQELFWWAGDGTGLRLLDMGLEWARQKGCAMVMLAETGPGDVRMERFYARKGFKPVERFYMAETKLLKNVAHETSTTKGGETPAGEGA